MIKGVFLSIFASCLFGFLYYYPVLLRPMSTVEIFCWRLLMSLPAVALLICFERQWRSVGMLFARVKKQPWFILALLFSSSMLAIQMILFIWAPLNGRALSTSLGYFVLPLTMVISGRLIYKEKFSFLKKLAVALAVFGVGYEIYITQAFSWETLVVALGYPIYLIFRRQMQMDGIAGVFADFLLIAIGCAIFLFSHYEFSKIYADFSHFYLAIPTLGIITATAFAGYFASSKILPLGLFGLLGYIEPVLLAFVSIFFLNETVSSQHFVSYGFIWAAVCVLVLEGVLYTVRNIKRKRMSHMINNS